MLYVHCIDRITANFPIDRTFFSFQITNIIISQTWRKKKAHHHQHWKSIHSENFSRESVRELYISNWEKIVWHYRRIYWVGVIASISLDSRLHFSCRIEQQNYRFFFYTQSTNKKWYDFVNCQHHGGLMVIDNENWETKMQTVTRVAANLGFANEFLNIHTAIEKLYDSTTTFIVNYKVHKTFSIFHNHCIIVHNYNYLFITLLQKLQLIMIICLVAFRKSQSILRKAWHCWLNRIVNKSCNSQEVIIPS